MDNDQLSAKIIELLGGKNNIISVENCMTRLRVDLKDQSLLNSSDLKTTQGVLGLINEKNNLQIILGPGKAKKISDIINTLLEDKINESDQPVDKTQKLGNWEENKKLQKSAQKNSSLKNFLKLIGEIFVPMIPALIAAGVFNGFASVVSICINQGSVPNNTFWNLFYYILSLVGGSFITYLSIYTGINSAKQFGATAVLGGMVGAMSIMTQITDISKLLQNSFADLNLPFQIYNSQVPLKSVLNTGKGGIIGVIFGVWLLSLIEKWLHKHIPDTIDLVFTPLISMFVISVGFVLVVMPVTGIISDYLVSFLNLLVNSTVPLIQVLSGFILSAIFLPMVMLGLHQGLIPIYTVQLEAMGCITLYPVLAMAGAGQVGACIALYFKAKKAKNNRLKKIIAGALPAGFLGVGEPLIYGVTLPLGKPFITAGIGAGFGGAWCELMHVAASSFGPSGLVAVPLMMPNSMLNFLIGLIISYIMSFIITNLFIRSSSLKEE